MGKHIENQYAPDFVSPPGETLEETLEAIGMSQAELAERTGRPKKTMNEIIQGKAAITPETALQLERVLGVPASFWNEMERQYREFLAQQEETRQLAGQVGWLKQFPVTKMVDLGWIKEYDEKTWQLREVLQFFGIASPQQWNAATASFRKSPAFAVDEMALAAWLRRGEQEAEHIVCAPYDGQQFEAALQTARALTVEEPAVFVPQLQRMCAECGVAVVFVRALPKTRVSGATRWLKPDKALIQLSWRYKTNDQVWFSFFHEAGHIVKHGKRDVFIDLEYGDEEKKEAEADAFAADMLIPPDAWRMFLDTRNYRTKAVIRAFAEEIGIAPGIVVGRLQHERLIPHSHCKDLMVKYRWEDTHDDAA
ncbi:MAG: HigA family addiction module antitoxin [Chloroflexaceae bacterium]